MAVFFGRGTTVPPLSENGDERGFYDEGGEAAPILEPANDRNQRLPVR